MLNLASIREYIPFLPSMGEFLDLAIEEEEFSSNAHRSKPSWIKDFKLGCFIITSIGLVAKSIAAIAKVIFPLLRLAYYASAAACVLSIVINICWLVKAHQEEKKPVSKVQKLATNVRNFVSKRLRF